MKKDLYEKIRIYLILKHTLGTLIDEVEDCCAVFGSEQDETRDIIELLEREKLIKLLRPSGVFNQLQQSGYKHSYAIDTFSLDTITDAIKEFEEARPKELFLSSYKIGTGSRGAFLLEEEFKKLLFDK